MVKRSYRQPYPRQEKSLLVTSSLFPKQYPQLPLNYIQEAIEKAFKRTKKRKTGDALSVSNSPNELVALCLKHLKERTDPILGTSFYHQLDLGEIFDMDAIPHEMQRLRMRIGVFYQYLLIELMRASIKTGNSNIIQAFDGVREGDIVADIKTPGYNKNLRLYISVKKSADTVGGQDIGGVIRRLENIATTEKNLTSPYLCVIAIATPNKGKILSYGRSRLVRYTQDGHPYSENCEIWLPGFLYPYVTGRSAREIYRESIKLVDKHFPFYSLKFRPESTKLLKEEFMRLGIVDKDGNMNKERFFQFITHET